MYLKKTPNTHGRIRLSIVDNYYDKVKKCSRQKTIESIGFLDELQKIYDDPIAHFQKRVDQLNEEKRAKQAPINFTFYDSDRLCVGDSLRKNFGYAALSKVYHELEIDKFLIHRQRYTKEKYDANTIMKMLVYSRILAPASKKLLLTTVNGSSKKVITPLMTFTDAWISLTNTRKAFKCG